MISMAVTFPVWLVHAAPVRSRLNTYPRTSPVSPVGLYVGFANVRFLSARGSIFIQKAVTAGTLTPRTPSPVLNTMPVDPWSCTIDEVMAGPCRRSSNGRAKPRRWIE
ncbi:hypothetical protein FB567DRAFT_512207 [Paraphoma chrysanthemicola]|uniref:Secreted protein n=1 Tax=Paraphoma chrysanthemicola TaxID=798071 RepID=A0A8K0W5J4_9PLEO|nr:hypothetical protein FB567DRAFT_512207 [Paraphoma chrysanthemicola]